MLSKFIYSIHRILGTLLSILFFMWFFTGLVLIYHTFPKVNQKQKVVTLELLGENLPPVSSVLNRIPENSEIKSLSVDKYLGQTTFHIETAEKKYDVLADSTLHLPPVDWSRIEAVARVWCKAPIAKIDTLHKLDQWIPFGKLKKEFPIYKFHFNDSEKHQLYVSSKSAKVLQFTTKKQRFWAWMGAIPHWVYFTLIRQDRDLWITSIICLGILGILMTLSGIYVGIDAYYKQYKKQGNLSSPYKKRWYWWHHVTGILFGIFVFTWIFSGTMSVVDTPKWLGKTTKEYPIKEKMNSKIPAFSDYPLDYREVLKAYQGKIVSIQWGRFRDKPLYHIKTKKKKVTIDASEDSVKSLYLTEASVLEAVSAIHNDSTSKKIELLHQYDSYYIARSGHLPLPVYKVTVKNKDGSCYYVNPSTGKYRYVDNHYRWGFWLYPGTHSLKIKWLVNHPLVWTIVMWVLLLGGALVSLTGVILGFRYIVRKSRKMRR